MKKVSVLESTGSIGKKTVDLLLQRKEEYQVEALSASASTILINTFQSKLHVYICGKFLIFRVQKAVTDAGNLEKITQNNLK